MGLTAKADSGNDNPPMPSGIKFAVCVGVYDLGTHFDRMYDKERHSGVFIFEVPSERITITKDGEDKDLPRQISNRYTLSLGEKANLRRDLESWRGRGFSEEELDGFNILENIKKQNIMTDAKIMMCSSKHFEHDIEKAKKLGADDFLVKPFNKEELLTKVSILLG